MTLSIELGIEVIRQMMAGEVTDKAGLKGKHKKDRDLYRHVNEGTTVVIGGARVKIDKLRIRIKDSGEVQRKHLRFFKMKIILITLYYPNYYQE